jgi:4'-phosphopantetheinyl transferase
MILYYYQGKNHKGTEGEALIRKALKNYLQDDTNSALGYRVESEAEIENMEILRRSKGKPYFKDYKVEFSISHTDKLWVCLMADFPVGVDVQKVRSAGYEAIAKRFFSSSEQEYISKFGQSGFFEVWCCKEAYVKYTGQGFGGQGFSTFSVVDDTGSLTKNVQETCMFSFVFPKELEISTEIMGAICAEKKEELWIKKL